MISLCTPYVVTEIFCFVFAASILFRLNKSIGSEHEIRQLRHLIYAYFGMLVADIFWTMFQYNILIPPLWLNLAVDAFLLMAISCGCYFWFMFIQDRLHQDSMIPKVRSFIFTLPILVICVLDFISVFTGFLFYVDVHNHYQSTAFFMIQSVVNYFYLVVPTVACAVRAIRTHSKLERQEYTVYAAYIIAPLISGLFEEQLGLIPVLALSMFMVIEILFLMIQNMQIFNDAVTNLNNRRRLDRFLEECLPKASPESPVMLMMIDINRFKFINDTFGHLEGDNALRRFAGVLKTVAAQHKAFIARYGGDEFCLVTDGGHPDPDMIAAQIHQELREVQSNTIPIAQHYTLTASVGFVVCTEPEEDPDAVLRRADDMLYINKKEWHLHNG